MITQHQAVALYHAANTLTSRIVWVNERKGQLTEGGFNSLWGRAMAQALELKVISERFTFHSLRAYFTDAYRKQHGSLPNLHKNPATTANIYSQRKDIERKSI